MCIRLIPNWNEEESVQMEKNKTNATFENSDLWIVNYFHETKFCIADYIDEQWSINYVKNRNRILFKFASIQSSEKLTEVSEWIIKCNILFPIQIPTKIYHRIIRHS